MWTISEIKDVFSDRFGEDWERVFNNIQDESGQFLSRYDDDDVFIVDYDFDYFIYAEDSKDFVEYQDGIDYLFDNDLVKDFYEWLGLDVMLRLVQNIKISHEEIFNDLKTFINEDAEHYYRWLWERRANERRRQKDN